MLKTIKLTKKQDKKFNIVVKDEEPELRPEFVAKIRRREKQKPIDYKL